MNKVIIDGIALFVVTAIAIGICELTFMKYEWVFILYLVGIFQAVKND